MTTNDSVYIATYKCFPTIASYVNNYSFHHNNNSFGREVCETQYVNVYTSTPRPGREFFDIIMFCTKCDNLTFSSQLEEQYRENILTRINEIISHSCYFREYFKIGTYRELRLKV